MSFFSGLRTSATGWYGNKEVAQGLVCNLNVVIEYKVFCGASWHSSLMC